MSVRVTLPSALQRFTGGRADIASQAADVGALLRELESTFPALAGRLLDKRGEPRRFVCYFVNGEDIRALDGAATVLRDGDEVVLAAIIAGG